MDAELLNTMLYIREYLGEMRDEMTRANKLKALELRLAAEREYKGCPNLLAKFERDLKTAMEGK